MTVPSVWPEWLDSIWAKSPAKSETIGETLARHTWQVLCRLGNLIRLRPGLPSYLDMRHLWHLLFWAVFLHDWGKTSPGFQAALRGGPRWSHRHEVLSLAFVDWVIGGLPQQEATWLAATIAAHHRDADEIATLYPTRMIDEEDDPMAELVAGLDKTVVHGLWRWLAEVAPAWLRDLNLEQTGVMMPPLPSTDEAITIVMENPARSIRGWLRRYARLVEDLTWTEKEALRIGTLLMRGYLIQADHIASAHIGPLSPSPIRRDHLLQTTGITSGQLYQHQRDAARTEGNALLIAPTGSGKTEAALLWAACQGERSGPLPRLFYTLPYQASMNAMYDRLREIYSDQVGLLHGRSTLALYRRLMEQSYTSEEAARLAGWMRNLARLYVPPVRIFSPYHMLKAAYQLKGFEAMLADYAQAGFIFDEIHAYEAVRLALILETVRYLRARLDARFFVMSATLPALVRHRLEEAIGDCTSIQASPVLFRAFIRHRVYLVTGELLGEAGLNRIVGALEAGHSVLVTCNTVARAQEAYQRLQERLTDFPTDRIILVHGRFNGRDRLQKEQRILAATGLGRVHRCPALVVATQVVEVSLNIDLDMLFSDPAPLEALVQRFGRVNRKGRMAELAPVHIFTEPCDGQGIYDKRLVRGALQALAEQVDGQPLDENAMKDWLDSIYGQDEVCSEWNAQYNRAATEFRQAFLDTLRPFNANPNLEQAFDRLFDGTEVLPLCLAEEFHRLRQDRPLEAAELLVPISWRRWHQLSRNGRIQSGKGQWPPIVDVPYTEELGLDFEEIYGQR